MERKITQDQVNKIKTKWGIIGESEAIDKTVCRTLMVAPYDMTVLIIGESGTGKEVLPKIIHDNSIRRHKKLVAVNCGAIPEGTIDSELFGHVKGAFTDATSDHRGY
ncbi:MAG: sigma 54-interacting transcriptional regulator, partial [Muribaculaceae bacterium]|nr:sigma 54-interacting transcriptional regulator [Muribaculaceae bacterium]